MHHLATPPPSIETSWAERFALTQSAGNGIIRDRLSKAEELNTPLFGGIQNLQNFRIFFGRNKVVRFGPPCNAGANVMISQIVPSKSGTFDSELS
jgi:hypothetical protein